MATKTKSQIGKSSKARGKRGELSLVQSSATRALQKQEEQHNTAEKLEHRT